MDTFLLNPNIAYLFLVTGSVLTLLAIVTPGTGILEVSALFCLALAGYALFNLGINLWALILLILSLVPFIYAIRKPKREWALALSILGLIVSSLYIFPPSGWAPRLDPLFAILGSVLSGGFVWLVVRKTLQAHLVRPAHDLSALIGQMGEAKTEIHETGSVQVAGELWTARSKKPIPAGKMVRVTGREGFVLVVEQAEKVK
ncbi:MAG: NfeD family protein [Anaerolineales bacterium]